MNGLNTVARLQFLVAIALAWIFSISLTCIASMADLLPSAEHGFQSSTLFGPVESQLHEATAIVGEAVPTQLAPSEHDDILAPMPTRLAAAEPVAGSPFANRVRR